MIRRLQPWQAIGFALILVVLFVGTAHADVYTPAGGMFSCHQLAREEAEAAVTALLLTLGTILFLW